MEKKAHQVATFFLHFHMLDLLWKWGTCISFPSILFFIGSRKYWLVLLSAVSSQFSFGLLGRFSILSLLHVLLVKTGSKVYCGHKRDPQPDEPDSACDEHHHVTKTCTTLQLVWELHHQNYVRLFGNYVVKKQNWTFLLSFKCMRWNKKKSPLTLSYPLPNFELWCKGGNRRPQCAHKKCHSTHCSCDVS